jgi:hypothetical protein
VAEADIVELSLNLGVLEVVHKLVLDDLGDALLSAQIAIKGIIGRRGRGCKRASKNEQDE